jgi:para-aminobenzoate synthetase component 1
VTDDLSALDSSGWWAVVMTFEGEVWCARFSEVRSASLPSTPWDGPPRSSWVSSLDRFAYTAAVERVRDLIAAGQVYQVNVCRILSAPLPDPGAVDVIGLAQALERRNPAPHSGLVRLPEHGVHVVSASPELFLRRDGDRVVSRPIKGTAADDGRFLAKDRDENVMIVDLVRNDLGIVCRTGTVTVEELCVVEEHPGLAHLVSTVSGDLIPNVRWSEILAATFPPGSVSGAPKSTALRTIRALEPQPRGAYCGAVGWVDADRRTAELAVGIRTFWLAGGRLHLGTGAGITWASEPEAEWAETELKAARLLAVASGSWKGRES